MRHAKRYIKKNHLSGTASLRIVTMGRNFVNHGQPSSRWFSIDPSIMIVMFAVTLFRWGIWCPGIVLSLSLSFKVNVSVFLIEYFCLFKTSLMTKKTRFGRTDRHSRCFAPFKYKVLLQDDFNVFELEARWEVTTNC